MKKKKEQFVTFAEQEHRAYVKDAFNLFLVMACFICVSQALFSVPVPAVFDRFLNTTAVIMLRQSLSMLYQGVALYAPFLILVVIKNRSAGRYFSNKESVSKPIHYIFGTLSVAGIGAAIYYLSTFILVPMRADGFIINENLPLLGDAATTQISFIVFAAVIPAFFTEITFRGIVLTEIKNDSRIFAVIVAALINSLSHLSFLQMPFLFVTGLISGWLCLKTKNLLVSYIANGVMNGFIAFLYVFQTQNSQAYTASMPIIAAVCAAVGVVSLVIFFCVCGFKTTSDKSGLSKKDSLKAFFGAFGLWILIFITVFEVFFTYLQKPKQEQSDTPTASIVMTNRI